MHQTLTKFISTSLILCGVVCALMYGNFAAAQSLKSLRKELGKEIESLYEEAMELFDNTKFEEAKARFLEIAKRCQSPELAEKGKPLATNCEHLAHMCYYSIVTSAWNTDPSKENQDQIRRWLRDSKTIEKSLLEDGDGIPSESWNQAIENVHFVLANKDHKAGNHDAAMRRLRRLTQTSSPAERGKNLLSPDEDLEIWPSRTEPGPHVWLLLGMQLEDNTETQEEALDCYERAIAGQNDENQIKAVAHFCCAQICTSQGKWEEALSYLNGFEDSNPPPEAITWGNQLGAEVRVRWASEASERGDWELVIKLAKEANELGCHESSKARSFSLLGKAYRSTNEWHAAIESFEKALSEGEPPPEEEAFVRNELTDLLYNTERWDSMVPHLDWLLEHAKSLPEKPSWLPKCQLRKGEALASKGRWEEAEKIVSALCQDFPEWSKAAEADYLLARCHIAKADFDAARTLLLRITNLSPEQVSPTLVARSGWMIGETYMMQHKYEEAVESYQKVLSTPKETYWHAASAFQIGKCAELCQDPNGAIEWYRKVRDKFGASPFAKTADERLGQLTSSSPMQAERIGSGKKR